MNNNVFSVIAAVIYKVYLLYIWNAILMFHYLFALVLQEYG